MKRTVAPAIPAVEHAVEIASRPERVTVGQRIAGGLGQAIFVLLLLLLALIAVPQGASALWWEMAFCFAVFGIGVAWMIEGLLAGSWGVKNFSLLLPLVALALLAFLQTLQWQSAQTDTLASAGIWRAVSADPLKTRLFVIKIAALTLFLFLLYRYVDSLWRMKALVLLIILIAVASSLFGIWRQTARVEIVGQFFPIRRDTGFGQFINKNHFAVMAEMAVGLVLGVLVGGGVRRGAMLIYLAMLAPLCAALALSNSRGAILALLAQLFFTVIIYGLLEKRKRGAAIPNQGAGAWGARLMASHAVRIILIITLAATVLLGVVWMGGERLATNLEAAGSEVGERVDPVRVRRMDIWRATLEMIKDHPVLGVGFGGYWVAVTKYHNASGRIGPREAHNDYLELVASGGVVAAVIAVWFSFIFVRLAAKRLLEGDGFRRAACFGALVGIAGVAAHSLFDFGLHIIINAALLMALIAISTTSLGRDPHRESISV